MLKILSFLFILFQFNNSFAEILPANKAFIPSATVKNGNLIVDFEIKDKYYLYKDKITIQALDSTEFGLSTFSKSKTKNDDFFGEIEVFHNHAKITTPIKNAASNIIFEVKSQGCWEGGVCYPPMVSKLSVKNNTTINKEIPKNNSFNPTNSNNNKNNFFKALTQQSGINDPANVDIAFKFDAFKLNKDTLKVVWDIRDGYYLYNNKFNFDIQGADFGDIKFPQGEAKKDDFFGDIFVHKHQLSVDLPLKNIQNAVDLTVKYQGCWEGGVCYPPVQKDINITMIEKQVISNTQENNTQSVVKKTTTQPTNIVKKQPRDLQKEFEKQQKQKSLENSLENSLSEEEQVAKDFNNSSFIWILVSFFGFGILAAFTSCILPMIPILSSLVIGSNNPTKKKAFVMSLTFVIFMALTYAVVGVLAGMFGSNLQVLFQNPWIIGSFSLMFVALAFSMFGYYEIKIPNKLQAKLTNLSNKQQGGHLIGVAIMGVLSALIVGPCAAPVVSGALLYIGNSGDAVLGGSALFAMGMGMGLPLIIAGVGVATPRAGVWMDTVKAVFGVMMLGMAIYFLERVVDNHITIIMWATLLIIAPLALGVVTSFKDNSPIQRIFKAVGLIMLGFGIMLWIAIAQGKEDISVLRPLKSNSVNTASENIQALQKLEFKKITTLEQLNQEIATSTKPVMLDFYADWCIYCLTYDKEVFHNPKIASVLKDFNLIKVDITNNTNNDKEILANFKIIAPPAILFFKGGKELRSKRVVGEKGAKEFYKILQNL